MATQRSTARAAVCKAFSRLLPYINPVDGKNLNRVWPGNADGNAHGGEWDEAIDLFIITRSPQRSPS